jgi:hypothetical protein
MGTALSTPNKVFGAGLVDVDVGGPKLMKAVVGFNANSCRTKPYGRFNLMVWELKLHVTASIDSSAKLDLCTFGVCDDDLCLQGETELIGRYRNQGWNSKGDDGVFKACIADGATGDTGSPYDEIKLTLVGGLWDGFTMSSIPGTNDDLKGNFVELKCGPKDLQLN